MIESPHVAIAFNEPVPHLAAWREADAGVLNEVNAVAAALDRLGWSYRRIGISSLQALAAALSAGGFSHVFNLVESLPDRTFDACEAPTVYCALGLPFTGNNTACQILALDKWTSKCTLQAAGVPVPAGWVVPVGGDPLPPGSRTGRGIVKPLRADASEGIDAASVVCLDDRDRLTHAVRRIHESFKQPALVEAFIDGREINVSLFQNGNDLHVLPPAEIIFAAYPETTPRIVDYRAKWVAGSFEFEHTPRKIPADLSPPLLEAIQRCAREAWHALGCRHYARVDMRVDRDQPYVIEVNPNPDISPLSGFQAALTAAHVPFDRFVSALIGHSPSQPEQPAEDGAVCPVEPLVRWTRPEDARAIMQIVRDSGIFRPFEEAVADEVLTEAVADGPGGHYQSYTAVREGGQVLGWVCYGPTPCTAHTFDIYWMVVHPSERRNGIGSSLLAHVETEIRRRGGRLSVIETSSREPYRAARRFYQIHHYTESARLTDFYDVNDDKVVYVKPLGGELQ